MDVKSGFQTDKGKLRVCNEDALLVMPEFRIFAVADGVGGRNAGELASEKAAAGIERYVRQNPIEEAYGNIGTEQTLTWYFLECFKEINSEIMGLARVDARNAGMATTAVMAHIFEETLYVANIGDSRAYILHEGEISQITDDHTYVNRLIKTGGLTKKEAAAHPQKNVITRALGAETDVKPDFFTIKLRTGDRVLLCTDGLHGELTDEEICRIAREASDPAGACAALVDSANRHGGRDNITVICLEVVEGI